MVVLSGRMTQVTAEPFKPIIVDMEFEEAL